MPPFQGDTADLHYGVVVNSGPKLSQSPPKLEEAGTLSPLLLDTETTEKGRNACIQVEYEQFEQEVRQEVTATRRLKHSFCCLKILLAASMPSTPFLAAELFGFSEFGLWLLMVVLLITLFRLFRLPTISPWVVWPIFLLNAASLYFIYLQDVWDVWCVELFGLLNAMTLFQYYKYCRTKRTNPVLEPAKLRRKELFLTYLGTIKSVAESLHNDPSKGNSSTVTELREFHTCPPSEGFFWDQDSQLFLLFPPSESPKGWWIRGARKGTNGHVESIVLEGFVSPTHETYWTEGTLNGTENTLYYGKFVNPNQFTGEWLSYTGKRCHQYPLQLSTPADPSKHLGVICVACERNALPGMCYIAKDRHCCYCQSCGENDSSLVNDEEFVGLQLPEVNRSGFEDQQYDPPTNESSMVDVELGMTNP